MVFHPTGPSVPTVPMGYPAGVSVQQSPVHHTVIPGRPVAQAPAARLSIAARAPAPRTQLGRFSALASPSPSPKHSPMILTASPKMSPILGFCSSPTAALQNPLFSSLAAVDEGYEDIPLMPTLDELAIPAAGPGRERALSGDWKPATWSKNRRTSKEKEDAARRKAELDAKESADRPASTIDDSPILRGYGTRDADEQRDVRKHNHGEAGRDRGFNKVKAREFQKAKRQAQRERGD